MSQVYLVTGANSGLGLDSVRRLAEMSSTSKVYMGCRSEEKARTAMELLKGIGIDTTKLEYAHFDASKSLEEIAKVVDTFQDQELTGLILNAGGIGKDKTKQPLGPNNVLDIHQINLIAHIQLVEVLKSTKLAKGAKIVFSGSEGARGVPMMMIRNPEMGTTPNWFKEQLEGDFKAKDKFDPMNVYAKTKGFAALYFAEWARCNPEYKVWVVSPGGTSGTSVMSGEAVPFHFRVIVPVMMPMMKAMGLMHPVEDGSERYIYALTVDHPYPSGAFLASKRGTTGKLSDQTTLKGGKKYANQTMQKAAYKALSVYVAAA
jgi:NAD(P)-dependent dehydrogenase (short-subunit alcohol dehydrogenase family)